jgi:hypothetical protein
MLWVLPAWIVPFQTALSGLERAFLEIRIDRGECAWNKRGHPGILTKRKGQGQPVDGCPVD